MTYEGLRQTADSIFDGIVAGKYKIKEATTLLKRNCINAEATDEILEHAKAAVNLRYATGDGGGAGEAYRTQIKALQRAKPGLFQKWKSPVAWRRGIDVRTHIESVMHLFFLNGQKTVMLEKQAWLKKQRKFSAFLVYIKGMPEMVQELSLSWCPACPYGSGKFGGKVSENYLADARLSLWMFSQLDALAEDPSFEEPEGLPQDQWLTKDNKGWLKARGLDYDGSSKELSKRVADYMAKEEKIPELVKDGGGPVDKLNRVLVTFAALVSRAMSNVVYPKLVRSVERHCKLFLDALADFDSEIRPNGKMPSWLSHYNFLSMLNVAYIMERFGPLPDLWEGDFRGEGFIRILKPLIIHGVGRKNWARNLLRRTLRELGLHKMKLANMDTIADDDEVDYGSEEEYKSDEDDGVDDNFGGTKSKGVESTKLFRGKGKMFHTYNDLGSITVALARGKPVSCILYGDGAVRCRLQGEREISLLTSGHVEERLCLNYFEWRVEDNSEPARVASGLDDQANLIQANLLLLPFPKEASPTPRGMNCAYTAITSEWKVLQRDGRMDFVQVPDCTYNSKLI